MPYKKQSTPGDIEDRIMKAIANHIVRYNTSPKAIALPRMDYDILLLMSIPNRLHIDKDGTVRFMGVQVELDPRAVCPSLTTAEGSRVSF